MFPVKMAARARPRAARQHIQHPTPTPYNLIVRTYILKTRTLPIVYHQTMPDTRGMMLQVGTQYTNRCHTQIALAALSVPKPNRPNSNSQGRSNAAGSVVRFNARIAKQHCGIPDPHLPLETIPVTGVPMQWWGVNWVLHTGHKGNTPNRGASLLARV